MKITLVRHGETDSNKAGRLMGKRVDESLNEEGKKQAREISERLSQNSFDILFTSPLKRANQIAEIIADKIKVPVLKRDELLERDFGSMSGKTWQEMKDEIKSESIDFKEKDFDQKYDYRPYGGESVEDVKHRLIKFIKEIKTNYSDKKILVVSHGGILKLTHLLFLEKKMEKTPNNVEVHEFEV